MSKKLHVLIILTIAILFAGITIACTTADKKEAEKIPQQVEEKSQELQQDTNKETEKVEEEADKAETPTYTAEEIQHAQETWDNFIAINYIRDYEVDASFDAMYLRITLDDWNMNGYQEKKEFLYLMRDVGNKLFGIREVYVRDYNTNETLGIASRFTESVKK